MSTAARGGRSDGVECKEGESPGNETSKPWNLSGGDDLIAGDDLIPGKCWMAGVSRFPSAGDENI